MKWLLTPLFLILFSIPVNAVELGDKVRINQYCVTEADFEAHRLSGFPNPIPDDIDCYNTQHLIFQGTVVRVVYNFIENNKSFNLVEVSDLAITYQADEGYFISQPLTGSVFLPALAGSGDA